MHCGEKVELSDVYGGRFYARNCEGLRDAFMCYGCWGMAGTKVFTALLSDIGGTRYMEVRMRGRRAEDGL